MGRKSVLLPFYIDMGLENYPEKDKNDILKIVTRYLLGCSRFKTAKNKLEPYECCNEFQKTLKRLDQSYQILYRRSIRKFVQGIDVKIHEFDKFHLKRIGLKIREQVKRTKFPDESEAIKNMSYTVNNRAFKLGANRKLQRMTYCGVGDMKQIMYMRILAAYRTYLPSVGSLLPIKAFYAVLHRALSSSVIDKMREFDTNKAQMTVSYSMLGEDFENNAEISMYASGRVEDSPEAYMEAKETFYLEVPFSSRSEILI